MKTPQYFQGIVDSIERAEATANKCIQALGTKTVIDLCEVASVYIDEELEYVDCYHRFINECPNAQTDVPETFLTIECVKKDGVEIKLNESDYLNACEIISRQLGMRNEWEWPELNEFAEIKMRA